MAAITEATMKSTWIKKGKAKYVTGVNNIGVAKYFECGAHGGMDTAVCLKLAKKTAGSVDTWADAWDTAMQNV